MRARFLNILGILLIFTISGCVSTQKTQIAHQISELFKGKYKVSDYMEGDQPKHLNSDNRTTLCNSP